MPYIAILAGMAFLILVLSLRIATEWTRAVVLALGRFHAVKGPGVYFLFPFVDGIDDGTLVPMDGS